MDSRYSLPFSQQQPAKCHYPPVHTLPSCSLRSVISSCSHLRLGLPRGLFLSCLFKHPVCTCLLPSICHMPKPFYPPLFDYRNKIWRVMLATLCNIFPVPWIFLFRGTQNPPQQNVLKLFHSLLKTKVSGPNGRGDFLDPSTLLVSSCIQFWFCSHSQISEYYWIKGTMKNIYYCRIKHRNTATLLLSIKWRR